MQGSSIFKNHIDLMNRQVQNKKVDFDKKRNLMIGSTILVIGIGNAYLQLGQYQFSGLAVAAVLGIILNLVLPEEAASEKQNNQ